MGYRAEVDHAECVSSGACVLEAPEAFGFQEGPEALAIVLPGAASLSDERLVEVAGLCPVGAIHVFDHEGDEVSLGGA
jgi:ferredoxin